MKPLWIVLLVLTGLGALWIAVSSPESTYQAPAQAAAPRDAVPSSLARDPGGGEAVRVFDIEGMCCGGCSSRLFAVLSEMEEVGEAAVDLDTATAQVIVPEDLDVAVIERALTFDPYEARIRP